MKKRKRPERKGENLHIRVTAEQKRCLQNAAERTGLSLSSWLVMIGLKEAGR